jgi:hypothetical protein
MYDLGFKQAVLRVYAKQQNIRRLTKQLLNRDRNAAINIYKAGWAYIMGEARPVWLTKAWKEECLRAADHQHE